MADQKKWFKVWTSIVSDDDFDPSRVTGLLSLGRFCILGAYTALHGERGVVDIMPDTLFRILQTQSIDELREDLALKNVTFEERKNRHGKITVTWAKWIKYQEDSTQAERARASRSKRRGEEMRGDEKRGEEKKDAEAPLPDWIPLDAWEEYKAHRKRKRAPITTTIGKRLFAVLDELRKLGHDPAAVLTEAIDRNWTAIRIDWVHKSNGKPDEQQSAMPPTPPRKLNYV